MTENSSLSERLRHALTVPTSGVLGLVEELLAVSQEKNIQLSWQAGFCHVRLYGGDSEEVIEVPLRKSILRAALVRIAVLGESGSSDSVSPYGGRGMVRVGLEPPVAFDFVNTSDSQSLQLARIPTVNGSNQARSAVKEGVGCLVDTEFVERGKAGSEA